MNRHSPAQEILNVFPLFRVQIVLTGFGVELMKRRGELALIQQAIKQGWDITPKGRHDAIALVSEVLEDSDATPREKLRACSVAIQMNESNLIADEDSYLLETVKRIGQELEIQTKGKMR